MSGLAPILCGLIAVTMAIVGVSIAPAVGHDHHVEVKDGASKHDSELPKTCLDLPPSHRKSMCLEPFFQGLVARTSAREALALARSLKDRGVIDSCHHLAHVIAHAEFGRSGPDLVTAFTAGSGDCQGGYFHGLMERYVPQSRLTPEEIPSKVPEICNAVARATSATAGTNRLVVLLQCVHGFGHGLLADGFLPLRGAIKVCQSLAPGFVRECVGGVVMMHVDTFLHVDDGERFAQSMTGACASVEELNDAAATRQCASAVGEAMMWHTGQDLDKSLGLCARLSPAQRSSCAAGARLEQRISQPPKESGG